MEELEMFIEKCQQFIQSKDGSEYSLEVHWVDLEGKKRAAISVQSENHYVEVDWSVGKSYHIRSGNSLSIYRGALNEPPQAVQVFNEMTALLHSLD